MTDKNQILFAAKWCSQLINLCGNESTKSSLKIIENYFSTVKEVSKLSPARNKLLMDVHNKLQAVHQSPLITDSILADTLESASTRIQKTAQIISKPDENLASKPDHLLLTILSNFYSCFGSLYLIISYPTSDIKTAEAVSNKKQDLLEELLTTARDEVIIELIEIDMPYDEYFNQEILACLQMGKYDESDYVKKTFNVIKKIERTFELPDGLLIEFITRDHNTKTCYNPTMANSLRAYVQLCDKQKKTPSLFDFVIYAELNCKVEEEYFSFLFKSYTEKLRQGTIGYVEEQVESTQQPIIKKSIKYQSSSDSLKMPRQMSSGEVAKNETLWEKISVLSIDTKQDAPFDNNKNNDLLEENLTDDDDQDSGFVSDSASCVSSYTDLSSSPSDKIFWTTSTTTNKNESTKLWENAIEQEHLIIVINDRKINNESKQCLKNDFSKHGLKWINEEEEELYPWHFGLTSIHLNFTQPQRIDIQMLCSSSQIPFWITFKDEKQQNILKKNMQKKKNQHYFPSNFNVSLNYGALTDLDQFYYSPQHSSTNLQDSTNNEVPRWSFCLDDQRNAGGYIEWIIENSKLRRKKQLLVINVNHSIVVDMRSDGFDMYINQKCNMNEFEAKANLSHFDQRSSYSGLRAPAPLRTLHNEFQQQQRTNYDHYRRIGVRNGCYFPTIQFSLRKNLFGLSNINQQKVRILIKQKLSLFIKFFLEHGINICYGKINTEIGPNPYNFFQPNLPNFSSLIMKYSWQMLSSVGYRLQIQIDKENFLEKLNKLSEEKHNPDELFYRVCVYLSRIFSLKPFVNINDELQHAENESKRKRNDSAFGLISKIDIKEKNEAYIPWVTLTPTTIRIKPLKLCRTNRILRAIEYFGKALKHFVLVDIRDENGRHLQTFHFRDLRPLLLDYLENGFTLMDDNRRYKYLHHSQLQFREKQFWFYHHNDYEKNPRMRNLSFDEAYKWMGSFDGERNPAKYADRMALCFSTTKATVQVPENKIVWGKDIEIKVNNNTFLFTDGCGTISENFRNKIKQSLGIQYDFSAVQFRYAGVKGVVSVDTRMNNDKYLYIRPSMKKFESNHQCFEVCKVSAPRPLYLNRQAILLLSYRKISDASFLILQQQNFLVLIRALLRNSDAEKLIHEKIPSWFLPRNIHDANIDFINEPFFRQLLINLCLQSTRELVRRTRIRIPQNKGRYMMGIVDEYNVLKPNEVFVQYTILDRDQNDDDNDNKTKILHDCEVVITRYFCRHPGDIRTFTAINNPQLNHLRDVIVFSQQGDRPAPHNIGGSDLDGDEYLVIWHEYLVPHETNNTQPYNYESQIPVRIYDRTVTRNDINKTVLDFAENDRLGRLVNLHLAFADRFGIDNDMKPAKDVLSTIELAGTINQEIDSGLTGYHPLNGSEIKKLNNALGNERPDFMDNPNYEKYESDHILGKLFRASKKTLYGWNRLLRYHRHLRHLQVRTCEKLEYDEQMTNDDEEMHIKRDESLLNDINFNHSGYKECAAFANKLASVYRQEMFEILNLYGVSHESDLWCENSINSLTRDLENNSYTELKQLVTRTRARFFNEQVIFCDTGKCDDDTPILGLCNICRKRQRAMAVACYCACYDEEHVSEKEPILSLPWLFATPLLHNRVNQKLLASKGLLSMAIEKALNGLLFNKYQLSLAGQTLKFRTSKESFVGEGNVDVTVCVFVEILQECIGSENYRYWPLILSRFVRNTSSFKLLAKKDEPTDEWELILQTYKINKSDDYAGLLTSIVWTEIEDKLMHNYFQDILDICFNEGRRTNDIDFLNVSESIILLLLKMATNETII